MSRRETRLTISLQQWRGVDQRTKPTLVRDGFFVMSRGVFFGLGDNAERIPGKKLSTLLPTAVFNLQQFGNKVLIQIMDSVLIVDAKELTDFNIVPPSAEGRITEDGLTRITEDGNIRIIE